MHSGVHVFTSKGISASENNRNKKNKISEQQAKASN